MATRGLLLENANLGAKISSKQAERQMETSATKERAIPGFSMKNRLREKLRAS
jgi:hypothetical protein